MLKCLIFAPLFMAYFSIFKPQIDYTFNYKSYYQLYNYNK